MLLQSLRQTHDQLSLIYPVTGSSILGLHFPSFSLTGTPFRTWPSMGTWLSWPALSHLLT